MKTLVFVLLASASSAQSVVCETPCALPEARPVSIEIDATACAQTCVLVFDGLPINAPMTTADGMVSFSFPQGLAAGTHVFQVRGATAVLTDPTPLMICGRETWAANYYPNRTLEGLPSVAGCESQIGHAWGDGGPSGLGADNFSARYLGLFTFAAAPSPIALTPAGYIFTGRTDDGMRAWIDQDPLIDSWHDQGATTYTATRSLNGAHQLRVEYYEHDGGAVTVFGWQLAPVAPVITLWTCTLTQAVGTYSGGDKKATVRCPSSFTPVKGEAVKVTR